MYVPLVGSDLLNLVVAGILAVLAVACVRWAVSLYRRLPGEQQATIRAVATMAVQYAEQALPGTDNASKKANALAWAQHRLDELGVPISAYTLDAAIESAVYGELRHESGQPGTAVPMLANTDGSVPSPPPPTWAAAQPERPKRSVRSKASSPAS